MWSARAHTPFVDGLWAKNYPEREAEMMEVLSAAQPTGRMGTPDEIAQLALGHRMTTAEEIAPP